MSSRKSSDPRSTQGSRGNADPGELVDPMRESSIEEQSGPGNKSSGSGNVKPVDRRVEQNMRKFEHISAQRREVLAASNTTMFSKPATRRADEALGIDRGTEPPYNPGDVRKPQNPMYRRAPIHELAPSFQYRFRSAALDQDALLPETPVMDNPRLSRPWPSQHVLPSVEVAESPMPSPILGTIEQTTGGRRSVSVVPLPPEMSQPRSTVSGSSSTASTIPIGRQRELAQFWNDQSVMHHVTLKHIEYKMLGAMSISLVGGPATGRYMRWRIEGENFWAAANAQSNVIAMLQDEGRKPPSHPVYVEMFRAGPTGPFMSLLAKDPRTSEQPDQCGMYPFFGCWSIPGFHGGSCGNCVGSIEGHNCTFRDDRFEDLKASYRRSPQIREDIRDDTCPIMKTFDGNWLRSRVEKHVSDPQYRASTVRRTDQE
ncbi:hypothetical protein DL770_010847 [Monosporascus sp. CRB-9-2]|nr:hypothetical protein DL770_010847 [Monosporascus sp. CRB-9-2]